VRKLGSVALFSLIVAIVALLIALLALRRADIVERRARALTRPGRQPESPDRPMSTGASTAHGLSATGGPGGPGTGLSRIAVVRYNAFEDAGGQLSYSAALLDDAGSGLILTSIHSRAETRSYIKEIGPQGDERDATLSAEEREALRKAMAKR